MQPALTWVDHAWRLAACAAISALVWQTVAGAEWAAHGTLFAVEIAAGLLSFVLVAFRRQAPVPIALAIAGLGAVSGLAAGPDTLAAMSVATRRRVGEVVLVGVASFVSTQMWITLAPLDREDYLPATIVNLISNSAVLGWGLYIGSRRELESNLRSRAERAEQEQEQRIAQARTWERTRIAGEMHDVLAHRITQVSMQAGALAFRDDLDAERLRAGLGQIQGQANAALHELRDVLGVLREDDAGPPAARPQPTYADVGALIDEARSGGQDIAWTEDVNTAEPMPGATGRTVYRIVQEGLTNARKHAPGAPVEVHTSGDARRGISVELRNAAATGGRVGAGLGAGLGLVGLHERTVLRGGRLTHRIEHTATGARFVLKAWLPWAA